MRKIQFTTWDNLKGKAETKKGWFHGWGSEIHKGFTANESAGICEEEGGRCFLVRPDMITFLESPEQAIKIRMAEVLRNTQF